jgi:hypothetical protein
MKQEYSKLSDEELYKVIKKDVQENMWEWGYLKHETERDTLENQVQWRS